MADEEKGDSQDGSSSSSAMSPPRPRSPLCLFYFSHPFRVVDPGGQEQEVCRRRSAAVDAAVKRRQRTLACRKKAAVHRRVWRRYLRKPFWDLKTCLFSHCAAGAVDTLAPSLDEVLSTIRKAWESPRCLASDRETDDEDELVAPADMARGQEMSRKPRVLMSPGLPHRRYSVPETVMRKYALTKQLSGSSDSGVATVPVATPDTIQTGSSSDEPTAGTYSPDSSEHSKMGIRAAKGPCCTGDTESTTSEVPTRSTLHTVSEETSKTVSENCTESNSEPMSSAQTLLEESSFSARKSASPQNNGEYQTQISMQNYLLASPKVMGESEPPSKPYKGTEQKPSNIAASIERPSSVKGDLLSSETPGPECADNTTPSPNNEEYQSERNDTESTEPQSSLKDELSSSQTMGLESTDSRSSSHSKESHKSPQNISETVEPRRSVENDLTHTMDVESTDSTPKTSNKGLRKSLKTERNVEIEQSISSESKHVGNSSSSTEGTTGPQTSSRIDTSSSETMGLISTESRSSTTPDRVLATSGQSSKSRLSTPKVRSQMSTDTPDSGMTQSSPPGRNASGTPTESSTTTSDPGQSHSLSSSSDRASQSCSITPVESSVSASSPERPSVPVQSLVSSVSPPSSDHTVSTQDTTLSVKSDSTVLGRPVNIIRGCIGPVVHGEETRVSDSEQSTGHIEFMNDGRYNDSRSTVNTLDRSTMLRYAEPSPQQMGDSGHVTEPNCKVGEASMNKNQNKTETNDNTEKSTLNTEVSRKQVSTNTESADCSYQSKSWEIHIRPKMVQPNLSKCPDDCACGTNSKLSGNKTPVLPPKKQDLEFCGSDTCLVIRPRGPTMVPARASLSGTSTYPPTKCRSPGNQPLTPSHWVEVFTSIVSPSRTEDIGPYGWSRLTEEEHNVQLQLHRQRLWMNRRMSAANALPVSPRHGPISSCVGNGSTYRKSQDTQLVVPRYSALPRSVSMLVNTSSGECSSNSNSDSDCLSLADSLEERPSSCTGRHKLTKYDSKLVRGDVVQLLPDERNYRHNLHRRINAATPRGKGKAFFVSMETGLDEVGTVKVVENIDRQVISQSMPVRLKQKLSQRHQQMDLKKKRKNKTTENQDGKAEKNTEQENDIAAEVETNGVASLQQTAATENIQDPTHTSQTETKSQGEDNATETSVPTQAICKNSSELSPHVKSLSTAMRHTAAQSGTAGGTFILSRNEDQGQTERKSPQQSIAAGVTKLSSTGNTLKKEHNPSVKQLKASTPKTPLQDNQDTPRKAEDNISTSEATMLTEKKHEEQSPPLKPLNSLNNRAIVHNETKSSEEETGVKTGNSAGNGNKEHDTHKNEAECAVQVSTDVRENVKSVNEVTSPQWSNVKVEEHVITKEHKIEEQEHSVKTANGSRRKTQKRYISPKESDTNSSSKTETNELKYEDQNLPLKTSLNDVSTQNEGKATNKQNLQENGAGPSEETPTPETRVSVLKAPKKSERKKPEVPLKEPENFEKAQKYAIKAQKTDNGVEIKKKVQTVEVQHVKAGEVQHVKAGEVQHVKTGEVQHVKTGEVQHVKTGEVQHVKTGEVQHVKTGEVQHVKAGEVQHVKTGEVQHVKTGEVPRVKTGEVQHVKTGEVQHVKTGEVQNVKTGEVQHVKASEVQHVKTGEVQHVKASEVQHVKAGEVHHVKASEVQHVKTGEVQHVKASEVQHVKTGEVQHVKASEVQHVKASEVQHVKASEVQHVKTGEVQHVKASEIQHVKASEVQHVKTGEVQHVLTVSTAESKATAEDAACQKTEHEHGRKPDRETGAFKKSPEKKSLNTVSSQTSPEHKGEENKQNSASNTDPNSNKPELPPDQIRNLIRPQLPLKSSIPIMRSPISARKLSPDTVITFQQSLQNSHLPARTPRLQAQTRRSANLLGGRFHQRFEVIPEEKSGSLESSTEEQSWLTTDRSLRASLPAGQAGTKASTGTPLGGHGNIVPHSCLGLNQAATRYKQNRHSARNHEEGSNGNVRATNSDITRKVIRRPTCLSRIPRVEKLTKQSRIPEDIICEGKQKTMDYQGRAALAPHTEDKDLVTLSKGWLNFYLLKDGCGTPDSNCEEAPTVMSDKEKGKSSKKYPTLSKTVTVVGGDDNRIRQYTVQHSLPRQKSDKDKQSPTTLPDLTSNSSSRRPSVVSVDKLPLAVLKMDTCAPDSDHSTTYLCLPSPYMNVNSLLEGSGELACSESSMLSSSDSEHEPATGPAMLPMRRPNRQFWRGAKHCLSRSQIKHCKPEQFQSYSQSGQGASAGWTVTVAGTNACPQQPPELEMHLSFPSCVRQPGTSQSDSGLGEDNNGDKSKTQEHEAHDFLPPAQSAPQTHRWTLKVKSPGGSERQQEVQKSTKRNHQCLPDLRHNSSESKNSKKTIQRPESCFPMTSIAAEDTRKSKKLSRLWPKVKKILESKVIIRKSSGHVSQEVKSVSQLLENDDGGIVLRSGLAIQGSAITPEKKPRVPTMSEKDLTRSHTAKQ